MQWIALDTGDLSGILIDIGEQPTARLAIETGRRNERVAVRDSLSVMFFPMVPTLEGGIVRQSPVGKSLRNGLTLGGRN